MFESLFIQGMGYTKANNLRLALIDKGVHVYIGNGYIEATIEIPEQRDIIHQLAKEHNAEARTHLV